MTLGEKIKKYRKLRKLSQKELGEMVFKDSGVTQPALRICQYEKDKAAPMMPIRQKIADALDIDVEILSKNDVSSNEDILYFLFELEEKKGMKLCRENGKIHMIFEKPDREEDAFFFYCLELWAFRSACCSDTENSKLEYENFKGRIKTHMDILRERLRKLEEERRLNESKNQKEEDETTDS